MTLIMSLLSRDYAIQVSDRRFVWFEPNGNVKRIDDESNKSLVWTYLNAIAFTGIGNLGVKHRTDLWLANQIAKLEAERPELSDQGEMFKAIAEKATEYFGGPRISRLDKDLKRHAFVAVGWGREDDKSELRPHIVRIGNFVAPDGPTGDRFRVTVERLQDPTNVRVRWDGQTLLDEERAELDGLKSLDPATLDFADSASHIMGELIRKVSARNEAVGRGLLITVLPRASIGDGDGLLLAAPAQKNIQTFLYVPPDDREGIVYGPTVVSGGMVLADFIGGSLDAPEMADLKKAVEASQREK